MVNATILLSSAGHMQGHFRKGELPVTDLNRD